MVMVELSGQLLLTPKNPLNSLEYLVVVVELSGQSLQTPVEPGFETCHWLLKHLFTFNSIEGQW